jgi:iron complex outermembrane receptor protein
MDTSYASNVNATTAGGEAGVEYTLGGGWKADASLAYAWGHDDTEHQPLPQLPPLETRLGLTYDAGDWSIGALLRVATAQHRIALGEGNIVGKDLGPTGGFGVFSLNGGYRLMKDVVLTAGIDNVFNKVYAEHVNAVNEGLAGYVNTTRINEPGRTAWLKIAFEF